MPSMTDDPEGPVSEVSAQITPMTRDQSQSVERAKKAKRYRAISSLAVMLGIHVVYGVQPRTGTSGSNGSITI